MFLANPNNILHWGKPRGGVKITFEKNASELCARLNMITPHSEVSRDISQTSVNALSSDRAVRRERWRFGRKCQIVRTSGFSSTRPVSKLRN